MKNIREIGVLFFSLAATPVTTYMVARELDPQEAVALQAQFAAEAIFGN